MLDGYILLHRKLLNSAIFSSEIGLKIWIWCLLKATFKERDVYIGMTKIHLKPGQFIFGRKKASQQLNIAESSIRNWIRILKKDSYLDIKPYNKYSVISIKNWSEYQKKDSKKDNRWTTDGQQMDTNNKDNKDNKDIYKNFITNFNTITNKQYRVNKTNIPNLMYWLKTYKMEEIIFAIKLAAKVDQWWKDKITPEKILRTRNQNGACDYIGDLLNKYKDKYDYKS